MLAQTPIFDGPAHTDLGDAFHRHLTTHRRDPALSLDIDTAWLDVTRDRALRGADPVLIQATQGMLDLLAAPHSAGVEFKSKFNSLYEGAGRAAFPLAWTLRKEKADYIDITRDYALECMDMGMIRRMEDHAVGDAVMRSFVDDMRKKMSAKTAQPRFAVLRQVFDVYSEALVYLLLKRRGGKRIEINKIPEADEPTPDFSVELTINEGGEERLQCLSREATALANRSLGQADLATASFDHTTAAAIALPLANGERCGRFAPAPSRGAVQAAAACRRPL